MCHAFSVAVYGLFCWAICQRTLIIHRCEGDSTGRRSSELWDDEMQSTDVAGWDVSGGPTGRSWVLAR